eukprot:TRINITY_DN7473_c1_g1_i1.p1 TRINITY_DN7473_c1_g1~~TRINITY_DN7473_c1_g1_i1.p1  ORF type:complete len:366 (-),score=103.85 TRINITY_DN7473_c1_g1_i1:178-1275(-)
MDAAKGGLDSSYEEALQRGIAGLRRKLAEESQQKDRATLETEKLEEEVWLAKADNAHLQGQLEKERRTVQDRKQCHDADKARAAERKAEAQGLRNQLEGLRKDIVIVREEIAKEVEHVLMKAREEYLALEGQLEAQMTVVHLRNEELLRQFQDRAKEMTEEIAALKMKIRRQPGSSANVQLLAVMEKLGHARQAVKAEEARKRRVEDLKCLRERQRVQRDEELRQLEVDVVERRKAAAQELKDFEEAADEEAKELQERIKRNRRRASHAEGEAAKHAEALRLEEEEGAKKAMRRRLMEDDFGRSVSQRLPRSLSLNSLSVPARLRPGAAHAEFPVLGSLQALDQEIRGVGTSTRLLGMGSRLLRT